MSKLSKREDLVGLKINVETLAEMKLSINDIKNMFNKYIDSDSYVIGHDTTFCTKPHYHIHFKTQSKYDTITDFKSKHFKKQPTTKLYCAKNYTDSNDDVWFAYPLKENIIEIGKTLDWKHLEPLAKVQREIKKSKYNYNERENHKRDQKRTERDILFEWITENWFKLARKYKCVADYDTELVQTPYKVAYLGQIDYYKEQVLRTIPPKFQLERQARDYMVFTEKWNAMDLYDFDYRINM